MGEEKKITKEGATLTNVASNFPGSFHTARPARFALSSNTNVTLSRESGLGLGTLGTRALVRKKRKKKACSLDKQSIYSYSRLDYDHHKTPSH